MKPEELARLATRALIYEVSVNPKPGLVDPVSSGPHPDMSVFTFIDSSLSLQPYLTICAQAGDGWIGSYRSCLRRYVALESRLSVRCLRPPMALTRTKAQCFRLAF